MKKKPVHSDVLKSPIRDFPGGPVVKTLPSNAGGADLIPIQWAKDPTCLAAKKKTKNKKQKQKQKNINKNNTVTNSVKT